jgi:chromosomal replication initiation ATPase DnaA
MCPKSKEIEPCRPIESKDLKTFVKTAPVEDVEQRIAEQERRRRQEIRDDCWRHSGVRARHEIPPNVVAGPWQQKFKALKERLGTGILVALLGIRGCGKTQMAVELIRATCGKQKNAIYTTAMEIFVSLRDSYKLQESEQQVLRRYQSPSLLVIDEIQERGETAWEDRLLTAIIDYRYSMMKDTILISNQTEDMFKTSVGTSVSSRMTETGGIVECNWPSFRTGVAR